MKEKQRSEDGSKASKASRAVEPKKQPTPKQLQRLILKCAKVIERFTAKGWDDPAGLDTARANLQTAMQALETGELDKAHKSLNSADHYLTAIAQEAVDDFQDRSRDQ